MKVDANSNPFTRREFLAVGAAAGASVALTGCGTLPLANKGTMTSPRLRVINGTGHRYNLAASVSSDAKLIAFGAGDDARHDIYVGRIDPSVGQFEPQSYEVVIPATNDDVCAVVATAISPDGTHVACIRERVNLAERFRKIELAHGLISSEGKVTSISAKPSLSLLENGGDVVSPCPVAAAAKIAFGSSSDWLYLFDKNALRRIALSGPSAGKTLDTIALDYESVVGRGRGAGLRKPKDRARFAVPGTDGSVPPVFSVDGSGLLQADVPAELIGEGDFITTTASATHLAVSVLGRASATQVLLRFDLTTGDVAELNWNVLEGFLFPDVILLGGEVILTMGYGVGERKAQLGVWG